MRITLTFTLSILLFALTACSQDEPENYGAIPKDTLDKVTKEAEAATEEAKKKIDDALENLE